MKRICKEKGCKDRNGNCLTPAPDGLPVQCVGSWVENMWDSISSEESTVPIPDSHMMELDRRLVRHKSRRTFISG